MIDSGSPVDLMRKFLPPWNQWPGVKLGFLLGDIGA
jgi:hypothetical protein